MKQVEIFKTNVFSEEDAKQLCQALLNNMPDCIINFDLSDCDQILRVEKHNGGINYDEVIATINNHNFHCEVFPD